MRWWQPFLYSNALLRITRYYEMVMHQPSKLSSHGTENAPAHQTAATLNDADNFWSDYAVEMPQLRIMSVAYHERCEFGGGIMSDIIFKLTVNQLATSIRLQGIDDESMAMLNMLESLVIAGEIPFPDFMGRMQNLFSDTFDKMDPTLLAKLSALNAD